MSKEFLKVIFKLQQDEDGYPPVSYESIWVKKSVDGNYFIDNIPTYIYGVSKGDFVGFQEISGELFVNSLVCKGGHSTLRVYVFEKERLSQIIGDVQSLGANTASSTKSAYCSIDIPPHVLFSPIDDYLSLLVKQEVLEYEDACLQHEGIDEKRVIECDSLFNVIF